ncbi:hypothetical protein DDZ18_12660 [Marinicauda salina]|uniref:Beta/gamma crystallin 'Greek key' domain-containing protein n=1 Tax=Marinicauda salina TaxID=2135793 RepID=A0A2U2BRH5_9PROT|nr:beta/gamma crystallin-related protein [Marinicauda salina]PWE16610.1 hypothetical protein DDZ18_12660 [Marinicauda salina]
MLRLLSAALAAFIILPAVALAQAGTERHRSDGALVLYEDVGFSGRSIRIDGAAPNFQYLGFNDRVSSIRVEGGPWEVCIDADYRGACQVIDSDLPDMSRWAFNDRISSARPVRFRGRGGDEGLTLWSERGYRGRSLTLIDTVEDLSRRGFNDDARSIEIHSGEWVVCEHADFRGRCEVLRRGTSDLARYNLDRRVSSVAPLDVYRRRNQPDYGGSGYGRVDIDNGVRGARSLFFPHPEVRGRPVAACLDDYGRDCGRRAADLACRAVGYGRAAHYAVDRGYGEAYFLGSRRYGSAREGVLVDLLCVR